jgi:hypothetical protein
MEVLIEGSQASGFFVSLAEIVDAGVYHFPKIAK